MKEHVGMERAFSTLTLLIFGAGHFFVVAMGCPVHFGTFGDTSGSTYQLSVVFP